MADGIRITRLNAWFGPRQVLKDIDLAVVPRSVRARMARRIWSSTSPPMARSVCWRPASSSSK